MEATIRCITQACQRLDLPFRFIDKNKNFVIVNELLYFQFNRTPFNLESMARLCKDKEHQYECLKSQIKMPKTMGFLDFNVKPIYQQYLQYNSEEKVIAAIESEFDYPVVIKPNQGALGHNVFMCKNRDQISKALTAIYNKQSPDYDFVAIAQQYIKTKQEVRVICFDGEAVLCYERVFNQAEFGAKYWETDQGKALALEVDGIASRVTSEFAPALNLPGLRYVGLDVIIDQDDKLHLIELNSGPQVNHFIQNNGDAQIIDMYEKVLARYFEKLKADKKR